MPRYITSGTVHAQNAAAMLDRDSILFQWAEELAAHFSSRKNKVEVDSTAYSHANATLTIFDFKLPDALLAGCERIADIVLTTLPGIVLRQPTLLSYPTRFH